MPTFDEWFHGRFWNEWVVGRKNKPTEVRSKQIAKTITVNQQTRNQETTTPKGRTRRTIPMTGTLHSALKRLETIREGFVVRNLDGSQKTDGEADAAIRRICRRAGELPEVIRQAAASESDPDARILKMLGARGSHVAAESDAKDGKTVIPAA